MTADFRYSYLIFGLLLCASIPHGKCKTNLHDTKSTRPIATTSVTASLADVDIENARSITNLNSKTAYGTIPNDTSVPIDGLVILSDSAAEKIRTDLKSEPQNEELLVTTPRAFHLSTTKPSRLPFSISAAVETTENSVSETEKNKLTKTKFNDKKSNQEGVGEPDNNHSFSNNKPSLENVGQDRVRKVNSNENRVPDTKLDRISLSRGRLKFQSTDVISGGVKAAEPDEGGFNFSRPTPLSTTKPSVAHLESTSILIPTTKRKENSTRLPKSSSFQYRGDDGYKFETQFDFDKDDEFSPKFEDKPFKYAEDEPENNIDRIRNFNVNAGNAKIRNIVKKPQGFSLTTHSPYETDNIRKTVTRLGTNSGSNNGIFSNKKVLPKNPDIVAPKVEVSSEMGHPSSVSKNEILNKKQSLKTTIPLSNRPKNVSSESSLPTTSTAWALASLKTPTKIQKPLSAEISKRNNVKSIVGPDKTSLDNTIKPFVAWHVRLQKTTTEDSKDWSTTLKNLIEIDVETMSPIAYADENKMSKSNTTSRSTQSTSFVETTTVSSTKENTYSAKNKNIESAVDVTSVKHLSDVKHYIVKNDNRVDTAVYDNVTKVDDWSWSLKNVTSTSEQTPNASRDKDFVKPIRTTSSTSTDSLTERVFTNETTNLTTVVVTPASTPSAIVVETTKPTAETDKIGVLLTVVDVSPKPENPEVANSSSTYGSKINYTSTTELNSLNFLGTSSTTIVATSTSSASSSTSSSASTQDTNLFNEIKYSGPESVASLSGNDISDRKSVSSTQTKSKEFPDTATNTSEVISNFIHVTNETDNEGARMANNSSNENTNLISFAVNIATSTTESSVFGDEFNSSSWDSYEESDVVTESISANVSSSTDGKPGLSSSIINVTSRTEVNDNENTKTKLPENTKHRSTTGTSSLNITSTEPVPSVPTNVTASSIPSSPTLTTSTNFRQTSEMDLLPETLKPENMTVAVDISEKDGGHPVVAGPKNYTELFSSPENEITTSYETFPSNVETVTITTSTSSSSSKPSTMMTISSTTENEKKILKANSTSERVSTSTTAKPKLSPDSVPGYLMLFFRSSLADVCQTSSTLKENLIQFMMQRSLKIQSKDQVLVMIDPEQCKEPDHSVRLIPVALYIVDDYGGYNKDLINEMKKLLEDENLNSSLPIHEIVYHENIIPDNSKIIAAMIITSIAAVCFVLLLFLMCTIRNRQKMSHGQPCTPVTFDDYNLDNISEYNSIRRKGLARASKRSYGNPTFDDPSAPSKSLTYNGLLKACENRASLDEEFSQIPVIAVRPEELPLGAEVKNRYANVIPLPETRVSLASNNKCSDSVIDYINANYVKGSKGVEKFYIACQAPLQNTIEDFWKMVWKEQTKVIIMLTGLTENGVEKCADYLPPSEVLDCHRLFGDFQITLKKREVKEKYVISCLQLKNMENNLWREVTHLWYTSWPAQGVPSEQSSIIALLIEARAYMRNCKGPHVVHCSPGTGRTGTVIAIDICIRDYESTRSVNIPLTISMLRRYRAGAVQTKEQYAFIYKVLALYAKKLNGGAALDSM